MLVNLSYGIHDCSKEKIFPLRPPYINIPQRKTEEVFGIVKSEDCNSNRWDSGEPGG